MDCQNRVCACFCALLLSGCAALPSSGPTAAQISESARNHNPIGYRIVEVTPQVIELLSREPEASIRTLPSGTNPLPPGAIGIGDTLAISVFEAGPGLFSRQQLDGNGQLTTDSGATRETLPNLTVDASGSITVPYAGKLVVAGLTPEEAAQHIEAQLIGKSLHPQIIVNVANRLANSVMVYGDVKGPGRYSLSLARERLLDIVALAGGASHSANDTLVRLVRQGRTASARLSEIYAQDAENIVLMAGDRIEVQTKPRTFTVFGAAGRVSEFPIESPELTLAQGVARSGGPSDSQADPTAVYLFRFETGEIARQLGLTAPEDPVIYRVNLLEPVSYFAMQKFALRDQDMIYIANASTSQLQKALNLFASLVSPALAGKTAAK
jgi:polysaccharide biosynthesis/export protein